jgi:hypothetical protein
VTPDQRAKAIAFLKVHVTMPCPSCAQRTWSVLGMASHKEHTDDPMEVPTKVIPTVLVGCNQCFLVTTYAARPMGILPDPPKSAAPAAPNPGAT